MASGTPSELATSEMPVSVEGDETPAVVPVAMASFPPYPPYATEPAPASVADTIIAGRDLRLKHKSMPRRPVRPPPKPARPRGPKATDVKMTKRALRAHSRCLRKHGAILTDRLERMAKPLRRTIIYLWREHAHTLPPETIARLRSMLDADEPFKPDQAYEYFVNLKKTKKKATATAKVNEIKKDILAMCGEKRFVWARNATVAFARGIQQRLSRPGRYALADGMLRLSNIILDEICNYMHMRTPSRRSTHPKAKFMMEMSDKVAVWIDEILSESDDRMLMMDFDEDDDIIGPDRGGDTGFTDDFLDMMGDGGLLLGSTPAYRKFRGDMLKAFEVLTDSMDKKGDENLLSHGKFNQTYHEGADELKRASDLGATEYNTVVADKVKKTLSDLTKDVTPPKLTKTMKDMVEICSNYLAQNAEYNKEKGLAFKMLVNKMRSQPNDKLYEKNKASRTYGQAATELEQAKGLDTDHDDPNLSQQIHSAMTKLVDQATPSDMKKDMAETVDNCSKYLSQKAVDENERGPAFDLMVKELNMSGGEPFSDYPALNTNHAVAYTLSSAPGLTSVPPDPSTAPEFKQALHKAVDAATPKEMRQEMQEVIDRSGDYLSAFIRDRDAAMQTLMEMMKSKPKNVFVKRNDYTMDYAIGAEETLNAPTIVPFLPIKDIADEGKVNLTRDMKDGTPSSLKIPMQALIQDVSRYLSQPVAMRSGVAGDRYQMNFLAAVKKSLGTRPLFKYKQYGQTYADAAEVLNNAGPLESAYDLISKHSQLTFAQSITDVRASEGKEPSREKSPADDRMSKQTPRTHEKSVAYAPGTKQSDSAPSKSTINLRHEIVSEMKRGVPTRLAPSIAEGLDPTMTKAAKHLANVGSGKGKALEYIVDLMKEKGETPLGQLQGYEQTYKDGARRIENAPSLANDKVDKGAYETVHGKLTAMTAEKPNEKVAEHMPEMVDESSKYLASPVPDTDADKRRVLADLMARKEDAVLGEEGIYKMTYKEGGEDLMKAPVGVTTAHDEAKKKEMAENVRSVIPDKKMMELLKDPTEEGAAHLTDVIKGRGEAMGVIHEGLKKEKDKEFIDVGDFKKTHEQAAGMLTDAPHFGGQKPSPVIMDKVAHQVSLLPKDVPAENALAKEHMDDASKIASKYIAGVATKDSGLDAEQLAALDAAGFNADSEAAAEARRLAAMKGGLGKKTGAGGTGAEGTGEGGAGGKGKGVGGGTGTGPGGAGYGTGSGADSFGSETEEQRRRRLAEAEAHRKWEEEEKRRLGDKENYRRLEEKRRRELQGGSKYRGGALGADYDPEHEAALDILHQQLRAHGPEVFYQQPQTNLTHGQASDWISMEFPIRVDKTVRESGDTARLHKKFERKLYALVSNVTPSELYDSMQDVIIESARRLSEFFVATNYKALVREALVSEMQKRGNEILTEVDGAAETFFFAAQRLKKTQTMNVQEPCYQVSHQLTKKLEDIIRCRSMARKLTGTMKDHIKEAADYLSGLVTKPDDKIEAYIALLGEMEAAGDTMLIEGNIPKTHKDAAAYLRQLTSFEDQIRRPNSSLQATTQNKLKSLMSNVPPSGYSKTVMDAVIAETAGLLVSYISLQGERTEALEVLVKEMACGGDSVLLRHGTIRKSFKEGADMLRGKNTDQVGIPSADPVVARKIQIKLNNLMQDRTPDEYQTLMDDVIEDATMYLAVHFLQPQVIKVCKCMKNVFVQCELWCDEILRRVTRPCCTCSRHVSAQVLQDLAPTQHLRISPGGSHVFAPGLEISVAECPSQQNKTPSSHEPQEKCPATNPTSGCNQGPTTSYLLYSTSYNKFGYKTEPHHQSSSSSDSHPSPSFTSQSPAQLSKRSSPLESLLKDIHSDNMPFLEPQEQQQTLEAEKQKVTDERSQSFYTTASSYFSGTSQGTKVSYPYERFPTTMFAKVQMPETSVNITQAKCGYSSRTPIIKTDQMADWHAMMVSLLWNVQAWRDWIQENIDRALAYQHNPNIPREETEDNWSMFHRRVSTEALQWRQYYIFSRQLTTRLALRYKDKEMVSPVRATSKTKSYWECQEEMLDIIDMFHRWTQWLTLVLKETDSLQQLPGSNIPLPEMRWNHLKKKVEEYSEDWKKYNMHLKVSWEQKYRTVIADYLPSWKQPGPVWVVSACGAVPSGAVAAGVYDGEVIWVARTTHRCKVLPAALFPSKHCCMVYAEGAVHHYTKYQVMCNAEVRWVPWRGSAVGGRAVRVAAGVHVGRVHYRGDHLLGAVHEPHYRCHVVLFGRPFAFNCYELLMLADDNDQ